MIYMYWNKKTLTFCEKQIIQTCVLNHHILELDICDPQNNKDVNMN